MPTTDTHSTATLFRALPDTARVWVYIADRPLREAEQAEVQHRLDAFFDAWTSHGRGVQGAATILADRLLVLAAHIPSGDISGCGIDKSVHTVEDAAQALGFAWQSPLLVTYRAADGTLQSEPRGAFRKRVRSGEVTAATPVLDLTLTTLGEVRAGHLERPAGDAWHARAFRIPVAAG